MKLDAKTASERRIAEWLEENASEALRVKIEAAGASMDGVMKHITAEARKQERNGCACVADEEVFGWAVHYYEELGRSSLVRECDRSLVGDGDAADGSSFAPAAATEDKSCFAPAAATEDKQEDGDAADGEEGSSFAPAEDTEDKGSGQADFEGLDLFGGEA